MLVALVVASCVPAGPTAARPYLLGADGLRTLAGEQPLALASLRWHASTDGSTLVGTGTESVLYKGEPVVVLDAATGRERTRFEPPLATRVVGMSADGGRLVLVLSQSSVTPPRSEWYVLDTRAGRTLSTVEMEGWEHGRSWLAPDAATVYRIFRLGARGNAPVLVAFDLATGGERGRLELPDPSAAAIELSPDGRRFALIDAAGSEVTVVEAARLAIERVVPTALDGGPRGGWRHGVFAPDSRRLYLWQDRPHARHTDGVASGYCASCHGPAGPPPPRVAPAPDPKRPNVRLLDLEGGRVLTDGLHGEPVDRLVPAPDRRSVYAVQTARPEGGSANPRDLRMRIRRLDAVSLAGDETTDLTGVRDLVFLRSTAGR